MSATMQLEWVHHFPAESQLLQHRVNLGHCCIRLDLHKDEENSNLRAAGTDIVGVVSCTSAEVA